MLVRVLTGAFLAVVVSLLFGASPAAAQWENIGTVEGPRGKKITLTERPHGIAERVSVRAMGIVDSDTTQWALSLIGAAPEDTIALVYEDKSLPIESLERPEEGVGPTKVFISEKTFLTMTETAAVKLRVGDQTAPLPAQLRREMKQIRKRVN